MNYYEKKEIAEQMSIVECCSLLGLELVYRANRYKHPGWNGLSISSDGNAFTDFAKSCEIEKGGSINFVQWYYAVEKKKELKFDQAIDEMVKLKGYDIEAPMQKQSISNAMSFRKNEIKDQGIQAKKIIERQPLIMPSKNENHRRVFAYLIKARGIDPEIVQFFVKEHRLYESKEKHNCVFVNYDFKGNVVGANLRGTVSGKSFKQNIGNDSEYGFVLEGLNNRIRVFESVIDLMSRKTILKQHCPEKYKSSMNDTWMSLNGLKDLKLFKFLEDHQNIDSIILSTDSDEAGEKFCDDLKAKLSKKYPGKYSLYKDKPRFEKDWNQELTEIINQDQVDQCEVIQEKPTMVLK